MRATLLLWVIALLVVAVCGAKGQKYFGVNQPGLAFSAGTLPGTVWKDFPLVSNSSLDYFSLKGMNTVRVSVLWERLQPVLDGGNGEFNQTYIALLNSTIDYITNVKSQYVLLDVHNYFRYRSQLIGSANVSFAAFSKFWQKLAALYVPNSRIIFGTMNEPNGVSALTTLTGANAAIAGIRAAGATQLITISGSQWSSAESWMGSNSDWMGPSNISDPLNNWCYEMHQYFDDAGGTTVCQPTWSISGKLGPVTTWARTNKAKIFLGEFGINDSDECLALLETLMTFLKNNTDVWHGYTWWTGGSWWPATYPYLLEPFANGTDRNRLMSTLQKYFPSDSPSPSAASPSSSLFLSSFSASFTVVSFFITYCLLLL